MYVVTLTCSNLLDNAPWENGRDFNVLGKIESYRNRPRGNLARSQSSVE